MHAAVILFPGLNAETEMIRTLRDIVSIPTTVVRHTEKSLGAGTTLAVIPGGFSYGDYLRCGAIAKVAPILEALREHAARGGYIIGVCNGFQVLTEVGLIPGALTRNESLRFACHDVHLKVEGAGPFTPEYSQRLLRMPIAHGEGRYVANAATLATLEREGRIAYRYADASGNITPTANPNGSASNIAGVYGGANKNVLGLMPHPERMSEPALGGVDGRALFDAIAALMTKEARGTSAA